MGCGSSRSGAIVSHDPKYVEVTEAWDRAWETVSAKNGTWKDLSKSLVIKRTGWKTVRIFVSSTFKDFHCERELLVKKVFPDLRVWCENRRLYLVECDLRWGVPTDFTTEATLRACLGEIDRCFQDNVMPFFINMTSERVGWIPMEEEVPEAISSEYSWVRGLSVTEMEILHGAYRTDNPNALFMLRDPSFLKSVPDDQSKAFIDNQPIAQPKLDVLKQRIRSRFPSKRIVNYPVEFLGVNSNTGLPEVHVGEVFSKKVVEFFKERIGAQYPLDKVTSDPYAAQYEAHESFMKSRCDNVIGRKDIIDEIMEYICSEANSVPFLLVGNAGSGKSSIIAKIAEITATRATLKKIPGGGKTGWKVFYHFVGAVPGSTELLKLLMRLVKEIGTVSELPGNLESASQTTTGLLAKTDAPHWIIIVDALNQLDEDTAALINSWIPRNLSRNIRIVLSMIEDTPQHTNFRSRDPPAKEVKVNPLSEQDRREIVDSLLGRYNKRLDNSQMNSLMNKEWSANPLWLAIACEELRVFGQFRQVSDKINKLEDGLLELEMQVLSRFEEESGGELLVATVSLLEISSRGLLEIELLAILGDEENLMPAEEESAEKSDKGREKSAGAVGQLPAYKWAEVYRALRPFIRPFGDSGEGRLDFYHRSLSKAVRKKYFKEGDKQSKLWWHRKLADFFQFTSNNIDRKVEELPFHLVAIGDQERLHAVLTDWDIFEKLYDDVFSAKLIKYWSEGSQLTAMAECYATKITNMLNASKCDKKDLVEKMSKVARLCGQGGQHREALSIIEKAIDIETKQLGNRQDKLGAMYAVLSYIKDEEMKLWEYMYRSQLPAMRKIIEIFEKTISIMESLPKSEANEVLKGRALNRLAFYYCGYHMRGGDEWCGSEESKTKSQEIIAKAIEIFEALDGKEVYVVDCLITKAVTYGEACPEQIEFYLEAYQRGLNSTGMLHVNMDRLLLNMAIYYEDVHDYDKAYETFYQWYLVSRDLYGDDHPKSKRPLNTLREPQYRRIAEQKGKPVP